MSVEISELMYIMSLSFMTPFAAVIAMHLFLKIMTQLILLDTL